MTMMDAPSDRDYMEYRNPSEPEPEDPANEKCHNCRQVMDSSGCPTWRCRRENSLRGAQHTKDEECPI